MNELDIATGRHSCNAGHSEHSVSAIDTGNACDTRGNEKMLQMTMDKQVENLEEIMVMVLVVVHMEVEEVTMDS